MDMLHSKWGTNDRYTKLKLLAIRTQDSETKSLGAPRLWICMETGEQTKGVVLYKLSQRTYWVGTLLTYRTADFLQHSDFVWFEFHSTLNPNTSIEKSIVSTCTTDFLKPHSDSVPLPVKYHSACEHLEIGRHCTLTGLKPTSLRSLLPPSSFPCESQFSEAIFDISSLALPNQNPNSQMT
jgi:hypothetical protein